ncbi:MAG UNVERIFIED_CONTAM: DUF2309 domain-containing protein [Planctomycetaceae bacterium]|jgi:uncharacterized protein YbcC (UPF0753/DUF2309 family)
MSYLKSSITSDTKTISKPDAQFVFCIDVRSETIRRSIEHIGKYETFGFAGFFGLPISIKEFDQEDIKVSCPVLLSPKHIVEFTANLNAEKMKQYNKQKFQLSIIKNFYQSLKYNFTTSFALAEISGVFLRIRSFIKTFAPNFIENFFSNRRIHYHTIPLTNIALSAEEQLEYAKNALFMMGLTG